MAFKIKEYEMLILGGAALYLVYKSNLLQNIGLGTGKLISDFGNVGTGLGEGLSSIGQGIGNTGTGLGIGLAGFGTGLGSGINNVGLGLNYVGQGIGNIGTGLGSGIMYLGAGAGNTLTDLSIPRIINSIKGSPSQSAFLGSSISQLGFNNQPVQAAEPQSAADIPLVTFSTPNNALTQAIARSSSTSSSSRSSSSSVSLPRSTLATPTIAPTASALRNYVSAVPNNALTRALGYRF